MKKTITVKSGSKIEIEVTLNHKAERGIGGKVFHKVEVREEGANYNIREYLIDSKKNIEDELVAIESFFEDFGKERLKHPEEEVLESLGYE